MRRGGDKIVMVQLLRAVAAGLVALGHALGEAYQLADGDFHYFGLGWNPGVDIFFVISGFIMIVTNHDSFGKAGAALTFAKRRIIRIVPVYWFYSLVMLAVLILLPGHVRYSNLDAGHALSSFVFFPMARIDGQIKPLLTPGWTLNYEMFFYFLFALALLAPRRLGVAAMAAVLLLLPAFGALFEPGQPALAFWSNPIVIEFLFGVGLGLVYLRTGFAIGFAAFAGLSVLSVLLFVQLSGEPRLISNGLPALPLVFAFAFYRDVGHSRLLHGAAKWLGDSSYSLYLSHPFTLELVKLVWVGLFGATYFLAYTIVGLASAALVGIASYLVLEKSTIVYLNRRFVPA
jgi:peptidoglycan/LPS O-acetylase OafA/YrhL